MIACPTCGGETSVKETRSHGNSIRRRRICDDTRCNQRVTTIELAVASVPKGDVVIVGRAELEAIQRVVDALLGAPTDET